jgi:hypothetical protein
MGGFFVWQRGSVHYRCEKQIRMENIIEYKTAIGEGDYKELDASVNELIKQGFQPLGGVSVALAEGTVLYYAQAMVKYDDQES